MKPDPEPTSRTVRQGRAIYRDRPRDRVEAGNEGRFLVIEVGTGDYEIADRDPVALQRARARLPDGEFCVMRIDRPTAYQVGGAIRVYRP